MFAVADIDALVARMLAHGVELIGEMRYGDSYRLAYIAGLGIIVGLAEQLGYTSAAMSETSLNCWKLSCHIVFQLLRVLAEGHRWLLGMAA